MRFEILGAPIPKARPRFRRVQKFTMTFDIQQKMKDAVKLDLYHQFQKAKEKDAEALEFDPTAPCIVQMEFHFESPKSISEQVRNARLWGLVNHTAKPDLDNLEKFYLDCCNGIIFQDDQQIFLLRSTKKYSNNQKTVIHIMSKKPVHVPLQAQGILEIFGPERLTSFLHDATELFKLHESYTNNDDFSDGVDEENVREVRLTRTAQLLSLISSNYAQQLEKIRKKFPDYWREANVS